MIGLVAALLLSGASQGGAANSITADEVRGWTEGTRWCLRGTINPQTGCDVVLHWSSPARPAGLYTEVMELSADGVSGTRMSHTFRLEGDRQCFVVDPDTTTIEPFGPDPQGFEATAEYLRRTEESDRGNTICMAFVREADDSVSRRMFRNGRPFGDGASERWVVGNPLEGG